MTGRGSAGQPGVKIISNGRDRAGEIEGEKEWGQNKHDRRERAGEIEGVNERGKNRHERRVGVAVVELE